MFESGMVSILPENFKKVRDSSANDELSRYELNPLLLATYLIDAANSNPYIKDINDFRRTYRLKDTILDESVLFQQEVYKGFLAFKSTKYDLYYYLRQIGLDTIIEELAPSGLIDVGVSLRRIDGSWQISPNNALSQSQILISNLANRPEYLANSCEIGLKATINIQGDSTDINQINIVYNKISQLLLNRLAAYTVLGSITFEINISNNFNFNEITDTGTYYILVRAIEDQLESTVQLNNAAPMLLQPGGFQLNGYAISDVYQVKNFNIPEASEGNGIPNRIWDNGTSEWDNGTTQWVG
ncbi:hypothetical protein [Ralstonia phage RP13]|nr:hypothetical protein [Ralstonia phage RP13]